MPTEHDATIANATPCPFCGGNDFTITQWTDDSASGFSEFDAIECNSCMAGAPTRIWNKRTTENNAEFKPDFAPSERMI